jgi:carbon storage regulator
MRKISVAISIPERLSDGLGKTRSTNEPGNFAGLSPRRTLQKWGVPSQEAKEWAMLVLSRKKNESIVINNDITIVVVEIRGDKVRLGVEAPKEVPVHRREVYDAIQRAAGDQVGEPENKIDKAVGDV